MAKHEQTEASGSKGVDIKPAALKSAPKQAAKRRQTGDFWINLSIGLFISVCLLILGFELLVKFAH